MFKMIKHIFLIFILFGTLSCKKQKRIIKKRSISTTVNQTIDSAAKYLENTLKAYPDTMKSPRSIENGKVLMASGTDWTVGFFPGSLWYMYKLTGDEFWRTKAEAYSAPLESIKNFDGNHNLGFMLNCSFGAGYELTANSKYKDILVVGAKTLIKHYDPNVGAIKSWDFGWDYPVSIDNMMNLELLFLATRISGDSIYYNVAVKHANTTLENHFRNDNSSYHVVDYDTITGKPVWKGTHQGMANDSPWARGQAWALYGYTMSFRETKDSIYLDQAKKIADFITGHPNLPENKVPYWDFNAKSGADTPRDASAAAIIASALFELYCFTGNEEHLSLATNIITTLSSKDYLEMDGGNHGFLLKHSVENLPSGSEIDVPLNYADYYYLEALSRFNEHLQTKEMAVSGVRKIDGYRGIWFNLGQPYPYGDKYSGGLGTYTAKHRPMALYSKQVDKTFFVYGGTTEATASHLLCMVGEYNNKTGIVSRPVVVHDKLGIDDPHDNPSIQIDGKGYIWVFISGRNTTRLGYKYKSVEPYTTEKGFTKITEEEMTYPQPIYVAGKGFLHFFTKYSGVRELYFETSADGIIWSDDQKLAGIIEPGAEFSGHYQVSAASKDKIVTFFNRHPNGNVDKRTDLYYLETSDFGRSWQTATGEQMQVPLTNLSDARLIDYASKGKNTYMKDVAFDNQGYPVCLYINSNSHKPGPDGGIREWKITKWTGTAWETHLVTSSDHNYDMGSLYIENDVWQIIGPTGEGPQKNQTGGEIQVWESLDNGVTWYKKEDITNDSNFNHGYVRRPDNVSEGFYAFWSDGNPLKFGQSRLYFMNKDYDVQQMPYYMNTSR